MPMDPMYPLRRASTDYLQPYDLAFNRRAESLHGQVERARQAPVHGAGGLVGGALQRQFNVEGAYETALANARQRRDAQERTRLAREAELRERMRNQTIANYVGAAGNIGSTLGAGIIGAAGSGLQGSGDRADGKPIGSIGGGNFHLGGRDQRRFDLGG